MFSSRGRGSQLLFETGCQVFSFALPHQGLPRRVFVVLSQLLTGFAAPPGRLLAALDELSLEPFFGSPRGRRAALCSSQPFLDFRYNPRHRCGRISLFANQIIEFATDDVA
jgi:hypothetical protein